MLKNWNRIIRRLGSIYVDTIYEHTSANGVAVDGVNFKDYHIGLGNTAVSTGTIIIATETISAQSVGGDLYGIGITFTSEKTSGAEANTLRAGSFKVGLTTSNTQNWTAAQALRGVDSVITLATNTYTVTGASNYVGTCAVAANVTLTNRYGLYIGDKSGSGTLTNQYGIYLEAIDGGGTLNYALYSAGGTIFTAGPVQIGTYASKITVADGTFGFQVYGTLTSGSSDGLAMYTEGFAAGTLDGDVYGAGIWLQLVASAVVGAHEIRGLDVGIYDAGAVAATSSIVYGICISTYIGSTMNPGLHCMMRFNTDQSGDVPDAWFMAANNECIAMTPGTTETADKYGSIAVRVPAGIKYLRLYDTADG